MREEDQLQIAVADYLRVAMPPDIAWSAIEHAQQMSAREGKRRKDKGVRRGLPDLVFWMCERCLCIELKTPTGRQSPAQKDFAALVTAQRHDYRICRSVDDVEAVLREYGIRLRATAA